MSEFALVKSRLAWAVRLVLGFLLGFLLWSAFAKPYERGLAAAAQWVLRLTETPRVSRLKALPSEIRVERKDFPPASPRPGLPTADLHFNFVILFALFLLHPEPWRSERIAALLLALFLLWFVHTLALFLQVKALYATRLGAWSEANYGTAARNFWTAGYHFYEIAGRFAAPFVLWWPFAGDRAAEKPPAPPRTRRKKRKRERSG